MRVPDNLDLFEMHEREEERRKKDCSDEEVERLPFDDLEAEVVFYISEREEDIEFLEMFLKKHDFNYEKEVL